MKADEVEQVKINYKPEKIIAEDEDLKQVMHLLECGHFNSFEYGIFDDIIASLKNSDDPWVTLADFRSYIDSQEKVSKGYHDRNGWIKMSIMNAACSGFFSTDRTMKEYNRDIWKLNVE